MQAVLTRMAISRQRASAEPALLGSTALTAAARSAATWQEGREVADGTCHHEKRGRVPTDQEC